MHIDIDCCRVELYAKEPFVGFVQNDGEEELLPEVYKWRSAFWKNASVTSLYGLFDP
jgi:hypothetical protein